MAALPSVAPNGLDLGGGVAVITGAAGGIGFSLARQCAARGAHVLLSDIDGTKLENAGRALRDSLVGSRRDQLVKTQVYSAGMLHI